MSCWPKKQPLVARSRTEADYKSLAKTTSELFWIQSLLKELKASVSTPIIYMLV